MNTAGPCTICNESDHKARRCPELHKDLDNNGFFKPAGGRPVGGDDEDERLNSTRSAPLPRVFIKNNTSCYRNIQGSENTILAYAYDGSIQCL